MVINKGTSLCWFKQRTCHCYRPRQLWGYERRHLLPTPRRCCCRWIHWPRQLIGEWNVTKNAIVTEGLIHILNVALGGTAKPTGYYLALFSAAATPTADWTAASFSATASEIVSNTEGYNNATRPQWKPLTLLPRQRLINMSNVASVTVKTAAQLYSARRCYAYIKQQGRHYRCVISATKYPSARVFQDGDIFEIGYRLS